MVWSLIFQRMPFFTARVARHAMSHLTVATMLAVPISAQGEEVCASYWGESVEVAISVALLSAPPGGVEFFAFSKPLLARTNAGTSDFYEPHRVELEGKALTAVFCGVSPEAVKDGVSIALGPHRLVVPAAKLDITKSHLTNRTKIVATSSEPPVELNWVSPTKLSVQSRNEVAQIAIQFATPEKVNLEIGNLVVNLVQNTGSPCRAPDRPSSTEPVKLAAKLSAIVGADPSLRTFHGTYHYSGRCNQKRILEISFGEMTLTGSTSFKQVNVQILGLIELGDFVGRDREKLDSLCKNSAIRDSYFLCGALKQTNTRINFAPVRQVEIEARDSNVFPKVFSR